MELMHQSAQSWRGKLLGFVLAVVLAIVWVFCTATPVALAQAKTINDTNTNLTRRDFAHQDLERGVFVSSNLR
jgi:Ni/Co efflux regulator RcnB